MPKLTVMVIAAVAAAVLFSSPAMAVARLLETDLDVNDTNTWTYSASTSYQEVASGENTTGSTGCTWTESVIQALANNQYLVDADTTNVRYTDDNGVVTNCPDGTDTSTVQDGSGIVIDPYDLALLLDLPDSSVTANAGVQNPSTSGSFSTVAVDVNDSWTQTYQVKPYGYTSFVNVTITWTLVGWTTMGGYNVAQISGTCTSPSCISFSDGSKLSGNMSQSTTMYYAYAEHIPVRMQTSVTGRLLHEQPGYANAYVDYTSNVSWVR